MSRHYPWARMGLVQFSLTVIYRGVTWDGPRMGSGIDKVNEATFSSSGSLQVWYMKWRQQRPRRQIPWLKKETNKFTGKGLTCKLAQLNLLSKIIFGLVTVVKFCLFNDSNIFRKTPGNWK